jgi:FkbM family methyltransferase
MKYLIKLYRFIFARTFFLRLNKLLYRLGLSGMGVLNFESDKASGEYAFLRKYFMGNPEGVVLDVGANIGNYSRMVLEFKPDATVYGFEPHPITYRKLAERLSGGNFTAINTAVGAEPGVLTLYDHEDKDGSSHASLYKGVIEGFHKSRAIEHKVNMTTLDEFASSHNPGKIALLKIDTEGHELEVLRGAKKLIDEGRIAVIHFEFNALHVYSRVFFRDFLDLLPGYDFYRLLPNDMLKIESYDTHHCEIFAYQNIVAIRKTVPRSDR